MVDPYIQLAIRAYQQEGVSMRQLAQILGIGEKSFSRLVRRFREGT